MILSMVKFKPRFNYPPDGIGLYVSERFGLPIIEKPGNYDVPDTVFGISGHFGFCSWRDDYVRIVQMAKRFVYLCNDYDPGLPSQLKRLPNVEVWSHIKDVDFVRPSHYVPWTALTLDVQRLQPPSIPGLMYYGALRKRRAPLFEKYLDPKTTWISTTARAAEKWLLEGFVRFKEPFKSWMDLAQHEWTIYMEDPNGGRAILNRFFECLSAGVPMLFTEESVETLQSFGINPWPIVRERSDVKAAISALDRAAVVEVQRHQFLKRDWRSELNQTVDELYNRKNP